MLISHSCTHLAQHVRTRADGFGLGRVGIGQLRPDEIRSGVAIRNVEEVTRHVVLPNKGGSTRGLSAAGARSMASDGR
jgi:hypothetical protein